MKANRKNYSILTIAIIAILLIATGVASWIISISSTFSPEFSKEGEIISSLDCSSVTYDGNVHLPRVLDTAAIDFTDPDVFSQYKFEFRKKGSLAYTTILFDTTYVPSLIDNNAPINAGTYEIRYTNITTDEKVVVEFVIDKAEPILIETVKPTLGNAIYGELPQLTQPSGNMASYILFDGSEEIVSGSYVFADEDNTRLNPSIYDYSGDKTTATVSTKVKFMPESENYKSVEADANYTMEVVAYCGSTYYGAIEKALEVINEGTIYVIPGVNPGIYNNCTIKSSVTLCIPYEGETYHTDISGSYDFARNNVNNLKSNVKIAYGVQLTVNSGGTLIIGGITTGGGGTFVSGGTATSYTQITMEETAEINCHGYIECWGYIVGVCSNAEDLKESNLEYGENESLVNIKNGGSIQMPFIVHEHRGGSMFVAMAGGYLNALAGNMDFQTSPFNRFHFNSVEAALTIEYGGTLVGRANLYANDQHNTTPIQIISTSSSKPLISLKNGAYLISRYHYDTQIIDLDIYGGADLSTLALEVDVTIKKVKISTDGVLFPISWYYNIYLHKLENQSTASYNLTNQDIKMLPGANITIDPGVTVDANTISIYGTMPVDQSGVPTYPTVYPTGSIAGQTIPSAQITNNGVLNVKNIGGLVLTNVEGAKLNVNSAGSATVESKEVLTTAPSYTTKKEYLTVHLYKSSGVSTTTSVVGVGNYESKMDSKNKCGWLVDPINLSYDFNLGDGAVIYKEEIHIKDSNGVVIGYTIKANDMPTISIPNRENYEFIGWSIYPTVDPNDWENPVGEVVYANTVFYAIWKPIEYDIVYDIDNLYNGVAYSNDDNIYIDTPIEKGYPQTYNVEGVYQLPIPTCDGYQFAGWYSDENFENRILNIYPGLFDGGDKTIYALWNPTGTKEYTVTFKVIMPDGEEREGSTIGLLNVNQSCFSIDGVEFNLQNHIKILADLNNDIESSLYYYKPYVNDEMIGGTSVIINDSNTVDRVLTIVVKAFNKTQIIYDDNSSSEYIVSSDVDSELLPLGTSMTFVPKTPSVLAEGYKMVWFTASAKDNATFFISGESYADGISSTISNFDSTNNNLKLYGEAYYLITTASFSNKIYNQTATNILFYKFDFKNLTTSADASVSGGGTTSANGKDNSTQSSSFREKTINKIIIVDCVNSGNTLGSTDSAGTSWKYLFVSTKYYSVRKYCGIFDSISGLSQVIFGDQAALTVIGNYAFSDVNLSNVKLNSAVSGSFSHGSDTSSTSSTTPPTNESTKTVSVKK